MPLLKVEPYLLNLAGEYRVCSELIKRGVFATPTYGNRKSVDVYAIDDRRHRAIRIEVKTSQRTNFVTAISQKGLHKSNAGPDFWVLFQLQRKGVDEFHERFFVLTHREICRAQARRNRAYARRYRALHGRAPDVSRGVDNVTVEGVEQYEGQWSKILAVVGALG